MRPLPKVEQAFFALDGGLDLVTPAIVIKPGAALDAQNYEPSIYGGYRRTGEYERFDGRASPSAAGYWTLPLTITGVVAVGNTVTGATSAATGIVLRINAGELVLGRVSGTFIAEVINVGASPIGTSSFGATLSGTALISDDADYTALAADDVRALIQKVPGSGPIRGVWLYNDVVYAFRDNAGGTAEALYKSTGSGWSLVALGRELAFTSGGTYQIVEGDTITGATSGATAVITRVALQSGTWAGGDAAGYLVFASQTGVFQAENLNVGANPNVATIAGNSAVITLLPGGRYEFDNVNFTGSTATLRMYGCDGVNNAFEFDGTTYVKLRTGMAADAPSHVRGHRNYLFLSFLGSVQYSAIGKPYQWSVVLGAGEIATGYPVTGFFSNGGTSAGSSLNIFTSRHTHTLYGSSSVNFQLVSTNFDLGYAAYTGQIVGNNIFGLTARGIQALITTLTYGDFDYASISHPVQPLMDLWRGLEIASTTLKAKNQYRLFFSNGYALTVGLSGDKVNGILPLNYSRPVRCAVTANKSSGEEVTFFGSDDGYIYQDNKGTSQDGADIEAWVRLPFNHQKSPRVRKRWLRAVLDVKVERYTRINISYDMGYGTTAILPSAQAPDSLLSGSGGYWDQFTWDQFTWDTQSVLDPQLSLEGTEKNLSLLFYSKRHQDAAHTLQGVMLSFIYRRVER